MFILDTNVLSDARIRKDGNGKPKVPGVTDWLRAQDSDRVFLSVITLGENQKGIAKVT